MLKKFLSLGALFLTLALLAACGQKAADSSALPDVIKIGYVGPLTGNAAAYGQDVKAGIALYFEEHPTIGGKPVEMIWEDGKCNGQDAAATAQKLIMVDKVQIILGGQCSGETLALAPIAEEARVAVLSSIASSPQISDAGDYIFRVYPSDAQVGATLVDDLFARDYRKAALLSEQTDYSQGYRGAVKARLAAYPEISIVADEAYAVDNTDFRTLLAKVKESGADVLISMAQTPAIHGFTVKQVKEMGLAIQIYGTDTIDGPDFFDAAKDAAEGAIQVVVAEDPSRSSYTDFATRIQPAQSSPIFQVLAYDTAGIAAQAIEKAGYDGSAIRDYWYRMKTYAGIGGDHHFDRNGDNAVPARAKIARGGRFEFLE